MADEDTAADDDAEAAIAARFAFRCPQTWESLTPTADPGVRHCGACQRDVVACADLAAATARAAHGACVAVAVPADPPRRRARDQVVGMLNLWGLQGEPPIVSWLVPLDGASAGQTLPLGPGVTSLRVANEAGAVARIELVSTPVGCAVREPAPGTGLRVNGRAARGFELVDGDVLAVNGVRVVFKTTA